MKYFKKSDDFLRIFPEFFDIVKSPKMDTFRSNPQIDFLRDFSNIGCP